MKRRALLAGLAVFAGLAGGSVALAAETNDACAPLERPSTCPQGSGAITTGVARPDWTRARFSGYIEWNGCPEFCHPGKTANGWIPIVAVAPATADYACTGREAVDADAKTRVIAAGQWSRENGRYDFDVNPAVVNDRDPQPVRVCASVVYHDAAGDAHGFLIASREFDFGDDIKEPPKPMRVCDHCGRWQPISVRQARKAAMGALAARYPSWKRSSTRKLGACKRHVGGQRVCRATWRTRFGRRARWLFVRAGNPPTVVLSAAPRR